MQELLNKYFDRELFINGKSVAASEKTTVYSPFSGEVIGTIPLASSEEVDQAITAAYEKRSFLKKMPLFTRAEILKKVALLLSERSEVAAKIISIEAAKPIKTARDEVERTIQTYIFAAEEAKRLHGEMLPMEAAPGGVNRIGYTVRNPVGVVGAITPFNFPMNLVAHKLGPAVAAGNPVVLKPASQTPFSSYFIAELFQEAGLPDGCLNVVTGKGSKVGEQIVTDERISKITFTGSPEVGKGIRNKAGLKKVTLELGSNAALIIDKDTNVSDIVGRCVAGAFSFQGQVCISLQRVYVHEYLYDEFLNKMKVAAEQLQIGDPADESTDVSALIHPHETERALRWIEEAKQEGARVILGGKAEGRVLLPTILADVKDTATVSCQEVFAPIVVVNPISSIEEGIEKVNDSRYGLQAGIYTKDIETALHATESLEVGGVIVNDIPTFRVDHMPYGGVKDSGIGREGVKYAIEEMTELKLVVFNRM